MERMLIRWAIPDDAEDLGFIHACGWKVAYKGIIPDEVLDNITAEKRMKYFEKALKEKKEETGILIVEDKKVGFVTLGINRDEDLDNNYGEIWGVYLLPEYWGKGFGKILMNWGIDELVKRGFGIITLWVLEENLKAIGFYKELGFVQDGLVKEIKVGKPLNEMRMVKSFDN